MSDLVDRFNSEQFCPEDVEGTPESGPDFHFPSFVATGKVDGDWVEVCRRGRGNSPDEVVWIRDAKPRIQVRDEEEELTAPVWRRKIFPEGSEYVLTESPSAAYNRVVIEGPTWQAKGATAIEDPDGYIFEVFGVKYLTHHEDAVNILASSKNRAYLLEWSPVLVVCAEVLEAPDWAPQELMQGRMVWFMMDDLCEPDKIALWQFIGQSETL